MQRILVIEDDPKVQKSMSRLFEPEGFAVEIAGDGLSGVQAFSARPANVVLLDLRMPGMGGRDVCREIKRLSTSVPIIVVSATSDETDKVLLLELGADDYVPSRFRPASCWREYGPRCVAREGRHSRNVSSLVRWTSISRACNSPVLVSRFR